MIDRLIKGILTGSSFIASVTLLFMMIIIVGEIIARVLFSHSFQVVHELSAYLLVAIIFVGAAFSFQSGSFVRIEILREKYPHKIKKIIEMIFMAILLIYLAVLTYFISILTINSYTLGSSSTSVMRTPLYLPQSLMMFGMLLFFVYVLLRFFKLIIHPGDPNERREE
ncbi:TRAP transporter small permease [Alkalihalobacillus oceani]|uniref:TRAP transporter small permease n=1 Tax=Halalkalibacter oceani TaxID=1653776 RepID=A0A9X2ISF8_9BACI|nr:TRAP transporter small permease [Halalkalibacter oceani]MCM3716513.1 TRAP transporter small permease [Halalkalibacter oceani]